MPKLFKFKKLHVFAISSENMENEVDFSSADKHESFLQVDGTFLGICNQANPNLPK